MPMLESPRPRTARLRGQAFAAALLASGAVAAGSLGISGAIAQQEGRRLPRHASAALEQAAWYMMRLQARPGTVVLAAQGTQEGHWRFVNRVGEMFTVGTPDEMKRVIAVLYPEAKANARVSLYLTEDTIFRQRAALKALPANAELNVVIAGGSYRLLRRSDGLGLFAELRGNLAVEIGDQGLFAETLWQLARPLGTARVRVLALQPGGPRALAASPPVDAARRPLVDAIDPANLAAAMGSVAGQMLLVVGRLDGDALYVRPSSGPEHVLSFSDLLKSAAGADVNLVVLQTAATPRQPAGRNPLWSPERALQRAQVADLLSGIAGRNRPVAVAATAAGRRTVLKVSTGGDLPAALAAGSAGDRLAEIVAGIAGRAAIAGAAASLLSAERQRELDWRILPGIPAAAQIGYLGLVVLGLLGMPVARAWWQRLWPPEAAEEYAGRGGYWAACGVRGLVFLLVFLPATAAVAGPYNLASQIGEALRAPGRTWRWLGAREEGAPNPHRGKPSALDELMRGGAPESRRRSGRKARA